eukprot:jgi/Tetstr1/439123/TSEL_002988.t1
MVGALVARVVYFWLAVLAWLNRTICHPVAEWWLNNVVATWEETVKSFWREVVSYIVRFINGCSASFISLFVDGSYYANLRSGFDRPNAWQAYHDTKRPSTFNALIERQWANRDAMSSMDSDSDSDVSGPSFTPPPHSRPGSLSRLQRLWTWRLGRSGAEEAPSAAEALVGGLLPGMRRSGSDLFQPNPDEDLSSTVPVAHAVHRGMMADLSTALELAITAAFDLYRAAVRFVLRMPSQPQPQGNQAAPRAASGVPRSPASPPCARMGQGAGVGGQAVARHPSAIPHTPHTLARSKSASVLEMQHSNRPPLADGCTAADVLHAAGYPSETHTVVTDDGYVLQLERIPRPGAKDVVFFMHGILDTALGWVANGVTRSIAFAAYDKGFDVWLGSCRSNPPRRHTDARIQSTAYWSYSINELGQMDVGAQVDHIHVTKCAELGAARHIQPADFGVLPTEASQAEQRTRASLDGNWAAPGAPRLGDPEPFLGGVALTRTASSVSLGSVSFSGATARLGPTTGAKPTAPPSPLSSPTCANGDGNGLRRRKLARAATSGMDTPAHMASANGEDRASEERRGASGPRPRKGRDDKSGGEELPYRLRAVGHSLGGAMLLIYAVRRAMAGRPHHLARLILLTPAGFHNSMPAIAKPFLWFTPLWAWLLRRYLRNGAGMYIPTSMLRSIMTKLLVDMQEMPALGELMRLFMRTCMSGDSSQWDRALKLPHYNPRAMPAVSAHTVLHLFQLMGSGRFQMYDYGNAAANGAAYGTPQPPDVAANYHRLRDLPVDLMAGRRDGVISPENVQRHLHALRAAQVDATLEEFVYGHLDFTFSPKDDLRMYILSRLLLPC